MKTLKILSGKAQKETERKEVMSVKLFLSYFDLFESKEVNYTFLEEDVKSYITYFFSNN